ncbi:MAG: hypothetical protein JSV91_01365 [Phycisphaerales bacterium]|nr:MAG: hypothetical protein JSV91_01365 [Phycisphaerales bacterium]
MQVICALALTSVILAGGCARWVRVFRQDQSRTYNTPPTAVGKDGLKARINEDQRLVVIGRFRDVSRSPASRWFGDLGEGMTDALARSLVNHSDFDVWVNPGLVQRVEDLLERPPETQSKGFDQIQEQYPGISHVIAGKVTDFHHTDELIADGTKQPKKSGSSGAEAIVAISLTIVDMQVRRVVVSDHVYGTSPTGGRSMQELYSGIALGSYLFWSTPLGLAGEEAIDKAMTHLNRVVPTGDESIRIVAELDSSHVRLTAGPQLSLMENDEFFIYVTDRKTGERAAVTDSGTGRLLKVRVQSSNRISATGVLSGRKPAGLDLRGAELQRWPGQEMGIRVLRQANEEWEEGSRRLKLAGEFRHPPAPGTRYFVCVRDFNTWQWKQLLDPDTGQPLTARILSADQTSGVAWLMGPLPGNVDLEDVVLCSEPPRGGRHAGAAIPDGPPLAAADDPPADPADR